MNINPFPMVHALTDIQSIAQYLNRIGAEPRSLRTAVVKENSGGYPRDIAVIKFSKDGTVEAPEGFTPTDAEAALIKAECAVMTWPEPMAAQRRANDPDGMPVELPDELKVVDRESLFAFHNPAGDVVMLQQRIELEDGNKRYHPWSYWSDLRWRRMEPDGLLPLWGIGQLKNATTVFIHEGAKAARAMARLLADPAALARHPWGEELSSAAHIGWIGGALSPSRTDWSVLKRLGVKRAYIVSDRDEAGVSAVAAISYKLRKPTFHVQFTHEWPSGFDLADEFPKKMFRKIGPIDHYIGPAFLACMHPATWMTEEIPGPKGGKPTILLRDEAKDIWAYIEELDMFVCKARPELQFSEPVLNRKLAAFSHTNNIASLLVKSYRGIQTKLCYRPDLKEKIVTDRGKPAINLHIPTLIKAQPGDASPWLEFMAYMFPVEHERHHMMRWCATLIAQPEIKMEFGVLLVSETQGIGKTTLGAKILAPLVGDFNVGFPSENDVVNSPFNGWIANKRLIIIGEIYSGHSWKAYHKLKSYITDKDIEYNQKYMRPYRIDNWAHIVASSNSRKALKMEETDRRWFYPQVAEEQWPRKKYAELNDWIAGGGLSIIKHWAEQFGDYVKLGERAPDTEAKKEMVANSRSEAFTYARNEAARLDDEKNLTAITSHDVLLWARRHVRGPCHDEAADLGKALTEGGMIALGKALMDLGAPKDRYRVKVDGEKRDFFLTLALRDRLETELKAVAAATNGTELKAALATVFDAVRKARKEQEFPLMWPI